MPSEITKENINEILRALGKQYRKMVGKSVKAEIVIVGGAAILCRYDFREMSVDIDAIINASDALRDAAVIVGDMYGLEHNWLNADFMNTDSYSPKLRLYSKYYRTFSNILEVRLVDVQCLLAMKLMSGREYKHDLSDIVGIIKDERKCGRYVSKEDILAVFDELYGLEKLTPQKLFILDRIYDEPDLEKLYTEVTEEEKEANILLYGFDRENPGVLNRANLSDVLAALRIRKEEKNN